MPRYCNRVRLLSLFALGCLGLLTAATAGRAGDDKEPSIHRLNIYNGSELTTYYTGKGLTGAEKASLEEYEQAQNELARAEAELDMAGRPARSVKHWLKHERTWSFTEPYGYGNWWGGYYPPLLMPAGSLGYYDYGNSGVYFLDRTQSGFETINQPCADADRLKAAQALRERVAAARKRADAAADRVHKSDRLRKALGLPKRNGMD
jgi:hypothetical protein